jgi:uroporphyrinogen decarboxylase
MVMTSRDRVLMAFAHEEPDRVPAWCGASPEFIEKAKRELNLADNEHLSVRFRDDFRRVHARYVGPKFPLSVEGATSRTLFGVERKGVGVGQPIHHPLANATIDQVHGYNWPDPKWMDVSHIREDALQWNREYAIFGGDWSAFWHDAIDLFGMENLFLSMTDDPERVDALMGHLVDFYFDVNQRIFDAAADAIDIFFIGKIGRAHV